MASIGWSWAVLAVWAYYCVDLERWVIETTVASEGPHGENNLGITGIVYFIPMIASILGLTLAKWFMPFLALATAFALVRRPLFFIIAVILETIAMVVATVLLVVFFFFWPLWIIVFLLQVVFSAYLLLVVTERRELRDSRASSTAAEAIRVATQPN